MRFYKMACVVFVLCVTIGLAADLRYNVGWLYNKSGTKRQSSSGAISTNLAQNALISNVQRVYATNASMVMGSVTNSGFLYCRNLSSTTWVELGKLHVGTNFAPVLRIPPGGVVQCWLSLITPRLKCNPSFDYADIDYTLTER